MRNRIFVQAVLRRRADEAAFLNITSFRQGVVADLLMLQVLASASEKHLRISHRRRGHTRVH
ncbi:hypothetical protein EON64_07690 [archaeon]|nr:MAG: hypothetical protein EON64_07690 [archaeon]